MPGDPRVERILDNLNTLAEHPTGWSPSNAHAWRTVALEARQVIESLDELGPDSAIEQGISRLEMLRLLRGEHPESQVRYRGHHVSVDVNPLDGLVIVRLVYTEHDGTPGFATLMGAGGDHARAVRVLREIDITIDAALALHLPSVDLTAPSVVAFAETVSAAAIDRALDAAKQVADQTAHDPVANSAVWDVIDRLQKLRPVDAPTEQDRAEAEADDEREGKAAARVEEVQTDGE